RMTLESKINHSRSGSRNSRKIRSQIPLRAHRSNRLHTEFQLPNRSGRSRHWAPVFAIQRTASTKRRLSPGLVAVRGQEVRPARGQVPGNVLNDDGDAVGVLAWLLEEILVLDLAKRFFGKLLVLAEAEDDVFEVSLPQRHT